MNTQENLLAVLEENASLLQKSQINIKKCPKARLTKGYIEARLRVIDDYWNSFKNAHQELIKCTSKELRQKLPYFANDEYHTYEEIYTALQGDLRDMITPQYESSAMNSSTENTTMSIGNSRTGVQLPKIQLPIFSGSYEEWPTFKDLFTSLVHNNNTLSDVQKLRYLKTSISAEAQVLLKPIQVTSQNYAHAWEILSARYGNKRMILNHTMKKLFNQKKMNTQSAAQLKCLLDTTTECLNNLENNGISTISRDPVIIYLLVQKLDSETHKNWEEYAYKEECQALPTWNELKKFLESKFRTLELISTNTRIDHRRDLNKDRSSYQSYAATPATIEKVCVMCKGDHKLCHCKEFTKMEPIDRSEFVKTNHLCFNCLVPGHSVSRCKSTGSCRICHRRHHSLLHVNKVESVASSSSSQPLASSHVVENEEVHINTMMAAPVSTRQNVALLATAIVKATSEQGHIISLRALIDPGSQATFISEKATQMLKLKRQPAKGTVIGVGSTRTEIKHVVQLHIRSQWDQTYSLPTQAYVMSKQLTTKIPAKTIIQQSWPHLKGLNLADPTFFKPGSIDLLLGIKEYTQILEQNLIKGPPGTPTAQKTSLGWILFGDLISRPENTHLS